jgi:hypothetical protein
MTPAQIAEAQRAVCGLPSTVTAATSISADAFVGVPLVGLGQRD